MKAKIQPLHERNSGLANPVGKDVMGLHEAFRWWRSLSIANERNSSIMKTRLAILLTAFSTLAIVNPSFGQVSISGGVQINVPAPSVEVSTPGFGLQINAVGDFYQPLTPYGTWIEFGSYGRCWHPTQVAGDWQPYTYGSWEYSDAGWYFNSEEPWGWATCHYGSWAFEPNIGWIWIPGIQWAPAWVTWRTSDDYIGWAPCGPGRAVLAPSLFVFVGVHNFGGSFRPGGNVFIRNNTTIINRTRVINNFNSRTVNVDGRQKTIYANTGPNVQHVQQATGRQFTPRPVTDVVRQSKSRAPENLRNNENRQPEQQRYNNQQREQQQREQQQRQQHPEAVPPTGREQQHNYNNENPNQLNQQQREQQQREQQQRENQNRLNQEQQHNNNLQNQNRLNQQQQQERQQHPQAMPPTGQEQQRNYNNQNQNRQNQAREHSMPQTAPSERNMPPTGREVTPPSQRQQEVKPSQTPTERPTPSERSTPAERPTPAQPATPHERNVAPTGRENAPSSQRQQEARPSQAPEQHAPPGQEKKDNKDEQ
jgi:hypothetical protein